MTDDWRAISEAALALEPVFVVGVPRSGTTALRSTLDHHPRFRARDVRSIETRIFVDPDATLDLGRPEAARLRTFLLDDDAAAARLERAARAVRDGGGTDDDLVRVFFAVAAEARGVERPLEKTPRHLDHLDAIFRAFPRAQVLACTRHPVDVYSSYRKKKILKERQGTLTEKHRWLDKSPKGFARKYAGWVEAMTGAANDDPRRLRVVRYEDLTADPRALLREICSFLGEPFEEHALFDALTVERDSFGSPRPGHRIVPNEKSWTEFLDEADARKVEKHAADAMAALGYAPYVRRSD
ncbi:MAG: sulfotransferase family protein [Planctomycetota bacterium JB042]